MGTRRIGGPGFLLIVAILARFAGGAADQPEPSVHVYFSPRGICTGAIVAELTKAKDSVLIQAYSFPATPIAKALVHAHKRGVGSFEKQESDSSIHKRTDVPAAHGWPEQCSGYSVPVGGLLTGLRKGAALRTAERRPRAWPAHPGRE